ncbi:unnamed protein product [Tuber melanosporum]|uniref:(Perigord truffle) hypothetical protein n=1 Tax=Tuber melanosporum (strain Mel28) TaxID=656061 RepID=D5GCQ7_TUBMM|nr:uncharacterized protein GSTUM_00005969001 [Tuber melanosporum]CAZ82300.1 unnamed protein product [Tuber melanosporum]
MIWLVPTIHGVLLCEPPKAPLINRLGKGLTICREQLFYLLEIYKLLRGQNTADDVTKFHYRERIRKVIFGYLVWVLRHAELNGFPDSVVLHWSGKVGKSGELVGEANSEEKKDIPHAPMEKSSLSEVAEPAEPVGTPGAKIDRTGSLLSIEAQGSIGDLKKASTPHPGKTEESTDPPPVRPIEPDIYKYWDNFPNCCRFLDLLDMCLTNYPDEKPLITRIVKSLLKTVWEPIEMSKHRGCDLWPDRLEYPREYPPPYARFWNWQTNERCGYGGQGAYVYSITTQVLVWRAVRSTNRLLGLVSGDRDWTEWMVHQSLDDKAISDRTIEAFRRLGTDTSHDCFPDRFFSIIEGHIKESLPDQWSCDIGIPSFVEDFFFDDRNQPISAWTETLRYYDTFNHTIKTQTPGAWEYFTRYRLTIDGDRRQELQESLEAKAYSVGVFASSTVTPSSHCPSSIGWEMATYVLSVDYAKFLYPQFRVPM